MTRELQQCQERKQGFYKLYVKAIYTCVLGSSKQNAYSSSNSNNQEPSNKLLPAVISYNIRMSWCYKHIFRQMYWYLERRANWPEEENVPKYLFTTIYVLLLFNI